MTSAQGSALAALLDELVRALATGGEAVAQPILERFVQEQIASQNIELMNRGRTACFALQQLAATLSGARARGDRAAFQAEVARFQTQNGADPLLLAAAEGLRAALEAGPSTAPSQTFGGAAAAGDLPTVQLPPGGFPPPPPGGFPPSPPTGFSAPPPTGFSAPPTGSFAGPSVGPAAGPSAPPPTGRLARLLNEAEEAVEVLDWRVALDALADAAAEDPRHPRAFELLGLLLDRAPALANQVRNVLEPLEAQLGSAGKNVLFRARGGGMPQWNGTTTVFNVPPRDGRDDDRTWVG
ncbi:MAG: hypothetical protein IT307_15195, partial [Chloroflexi bacterium]|nr:hypothetical protein [Chloroflexota bacterium]